MFRTLPAPLLPALLPLALALAPVAAAQPGTCMGGCPVQVISFSDYSVGILASMVHAPDLPEGDDGP